LTGSLSADAVAAYRERGYHFPIRVFSAEEVAELERRMKATEAKIGGPLKGRMNQKPHLLFPWMNALIRHPNVLDAVESVIGPDILCWGAQFFTKQPGDGTYVSWHQDATYWGLSKPDVVTAWIAFTPSVPLSGNMRVVPGTHLTQLKHTDTFVESNLLSRGQEVEAKVDEKDAVDITLQPGEMSLHHVLLVHGSEPNRASWPRVGFAVRYVPTYVRQLNGAIDSATLVRGKDSYGHFDHEQPPAEDLDPAAVEQHRQVLDRQQAILYQGAAKPGKRAAI